MIFKIHYISIITVLFFCFPIIASADILITEISWMGTVVSSSDEWLEIYNNGVDNVDLGGWTISWNTELESPKIIYIDGILPSNEFFILERTDDNTLPNITADIIYVGALGNDGEKLILKNNLGETVQTINAISGWQAGDNNTKETMQWSGTSWITAKETPRELTILGQEENIKSEDNNNDSNLRNAINTQKVLSVHLSPVPISTIYEMYNFYVSAGRDRITTVGSPVLFEAFSFDGDNNRIKQGILYEWSFGDGSLYSGDVVTHIYKYQGEYIVILNAKYQGEEAVSKIDIEVFKPILSIEKIQLGENDSYVELLNGGDSDVNLYGFVLKSRSNEFLFPKDTVIKKGKKIIFPYEITKLNIESGATVTLTNNLYTTEISVPDNVLQENLRVDNIISQINDAKEKISILRGQIESIKNNNIEIISTNLVKKSDEKVEMVEGDINSISQTASLIEIEKQDSFWRKVILSLGGLFSF